MLRSTRGDRTALPSCPQVVYSGSVALRQARGKARKLTTPPRGDEMDLGDGVEPSVRKAYGDATS
jgi:hypothetical protein